MSKTRSIFIVHLEDRTHIGVDSPSERVLEKGKVYRRWLQEVMQKDKIDVGFARELEQKIWGQTCHLVFIDDMVPKDDPGTGSDAPSDDFIDRFRGFLHEHARLFTRDAFVLFPIVVISRRAPDGSLAVKWRKFWPDERIVRLVEGTKDAVAHDHWAHASFYTPVTRAHRAAFESFYRPALADNSAIMAGSFGGEAIETVLKWKVLSIDDDWREDSPPDNKRFMNALWGVTARALNCGGDSPDVIVRCDFPDALRGVKDTTVSETQTLDRLLRDHHSDVDIVFLDVLDSQGSGHAVPLPTSRLSECAREFRRFRDVEDFPLLFVLSSIRNAELGAIAGQLGADFYFNKRNYLLQTPIPVSLVIPSVIQSRHGDPVVVHLSEDGHPRDLTKAVRQLMGEILFLAPDRLEVAEVRKLKTGKSEASTALWCAGTKDSRGIIGSVFRIIKFDSRDAILCERSNYRRYIAGRIDNYAGQIDGFVPVAVAENDEPRTFLWPRHGVLSYTVAGSRHDLRHGGLMSIREYLHSAPDLTSLTSLILMLDSDVLRPLHKSSAAEENLPAPDVWLRRKLPSFDAKVTNMAGGILSAKVQWGGKKTSNMKDRHVILEIDSVKKCEESIEVCAHIVGNGEGRDRADKSMDWAKLKLKVDSKLEKNFGPRYLQRTRKHFQAKLNLPPNGVWTEHHTYFRWKTWSRTNSEEKVQKYLVRKIRLISIEKVLQLLHQDWPEEEKGIVHGDLNVENIVISQRDGLCRLIDFAMTGPGYGVYDYVKLEVEIRTHVMARCLEIDLSVDKNGAKASTDAFDRISDYERATWRGTSLLSFNLDPGRVNIMRAASQACSLLRERAFEARIDPRLYRAMFFVYSARSSAFRLSASARIWAVTAAIVAAESD